MKIPGNVRFLEQLFQGDSLIKVRTGIWPGYFGIDFFVWLKLFAKFWEETYQFMLSLNEEFYIINKIAFNCIFLDFLKLKF